MNEKSAVRQLRRQSQFRLRPVYAAVLLAVAAQTAQANPVGGSVVNGSAGFATSGNTLTVTNTPGTIINWQGFSIGSNEVTNFAQQSASSTVLNRVVGSDPSSILGTLRSNGRVFLINPNGILFGAGAVVDVAGLVASTLNLSDDDFKTGNYHFTEVLGAGNISNAGNITAQDNGQIYLIAPDVENTGVIVAPNGEILLAAGYSVDLVSTSDPNIRVNITAPAGNATNVGQLIALSGSLGLFGTVVSNNGIVNADSATMQGGKIVFRASQRTEISGTVSANGATGGNIEVLGNQVGVLDGATVSANGTKGGGTVLIGGDAHGANPDVPNSQITYIAPAANISADATQSGNGGKVVVWSDQATQFGGNISSRGGAVSGNGGWVEVSGKQSLGFAGLVDTTAAHGMTGSLLLDPTDITISTASNTPTMVWTVSTVSSFNDPTNTPSNLNVTTLQNQLGLTNVTVDTTSTLPGSGNITVQDSIAWSNANSLTLNATSSGAIAVNALTSTSTPLNITNTGGGGLFLVTAGGNVNIGGNISQTGGAFSVSAPGATISMTGALSVGSFTLGGGTWKQVTATLPGFTANTGFNISGGTFIRALGGDGSIATPFQLTDIYGVQGMSSIGMLGNSYILANNINATATLGWLDVNGAPVGLAPVGDGSVNFTGQFDGQGHTISNLYINRPGVSDVGLFGYTYGASISNIGLVNASVSGGLGVGGLVGNNNFGGNISNTYVSGGTIIGTGNNVGGLVGNNAGTIDTSFASNNNVSGVSAVGGLAGYNSGSISNTYASGGTVTGTNEVGGLVGHNNNLGISIITSYASVSIVSGGSFVGGLAGYAYGGSISAGFWNTTVESAVANGIGFDANLGIGSNNGAIGMNDANMKSMANFNSATAANGNVNPGWDISASGTGTIWRIAAGITMPQLSFFPGIASVPNVIDEIVDIVNQHEKPKLEDFVVAEDTSGDNQTLPVCN